jgi:dihydrofolate reductase
MVWREIAAPLDCEPELDKRRPVGGNIGSDDGSVRPGQWRPVASARTNVIWMGRTMEHFHEVVGEEMNEAGAVIMGRRSFNQICSEQGWVMPDGTPLPWPVVVMQSQARESVKKGQTQFYFVTDGIHSAVAKAKELAGEKHVALRGASSVQQALKAGLLDELHMSIAHVLLGEGVRLFDHLGPSPIRLEHIRTLETPGATHLSFRVMK